ncbi:MULTISPECIES: glycosyltransferase [unclassified Pseudomonas]|uniref:glycosyltransferase n=1 Tax=unclassified Pseudomonas TaxID=196821 RepID=UPI00257980B2|nr:MULTISPECIES: glycosyltransferase [unclassified Pseudomonas]
MKVDKVDDKLKIAIPVLAFSSAGGMRVLSRLADTFISQGHEVVFFSSHLINQPYYPTRAKIETYRNPFPYMPGVRGLFNLLGMLLFVLRNRHRFDVFLANFYLTVFPVFLGALGTSKAWYYIQAYEPEFYPGRSPGALLSRCLAGLTYLLPLRKIVNGGIYRRYKLLKCESVIEPGIDLDIFVHQPAAVTEPEIVVGCIGRKLVWKGTREIIEAVGRVRHLTGRNLVLNIAFELPVGVDLAQHEYARLSQPHGDHALAAFYRQAEVFVATGLLQDGAFHYPCLEAMASGCTVISNYGPATASSALCVEKVDTDVIVDGLLRYLKLTDNERQAMLQSASKVVVNHSWPIIAARMLAYFRERT